MNKLDIERKYLEFFVRNHGVRHKLICGSRRSAKSFNIYKWLRFLALTGDEYILICTASYPAQQLAIQDFERATGLSVKGSTKYGDHCVTPEGSKFVFRSFDEDPTKAQGTSCSYVFFEECLNIDIQVVKTLMMSVTKEAFFAFNPTKKCTVEDYILPDKSNYLHTTYLDNKYLTEDQKMEFELMKERALRPNATTFDTYAWRVYGLGEFTDVAGRVFNEVFHCTFDEYSKIPADEHFGMDFGLTEGGDATTLIGTKIFNDCLYAHEYIYSRNLSNNKDLALILRDKGFTVYDTIYADYGGLGAQRLKDLASAGSYTWTEEGINRGFNVIPCKKTKIFEGVSKVLQYKLIVTDTSVDLDAELAAYEFDLNGKPHGDDHCIDALRYSAIH